MKKSEFEEILMDYQKFNALKGELPEELKKVISDKFEMQSNFGLTYIKDVYRNSYNSYKPELGIFPFIGRFLNDIRLLTNLIGNIIPIPENCYIVNVEPYTFKKCFCDKYIAISKFIDIDNTISYIMFINNNITKYRHNYVEILRALGHVYLQHDMCFIYNISDEFEADDFALRYTSPDDVLKWIKDNHCENDRISYFESINKFHRIFMKLTPDDILDKEFLIKLDKTDMLNVVYEYVDKEFSNKDIEVNEFINTHFDIEHHKSINIFNTLKEYIYNKKKIDIILKLLKTVVRQIIISKIMREENISRIQISIRDDKLELIKRLTNCVFYKYISINDAYDYISKYNQGKISDKLTIMEKINY